MVGALTAAILVGATGCTGGSDAPVPAAIAPSSPAAAAMRIEQPAKLLGTWPESVSRGLHDQAEQNMGDFKQLLSGDPSSAMGTAYVRAQEVFSRKVGLHIPGDDQRTILISAVSGTVVDPTVALDKVFGGLPNVTNVTPIPPGALGGVAGCGTGQVRTGTPVEVCAWSDPHSVGMVGFVGFAKTDDAPALFGQIRAELEQPAQ
jgi:hypothetical protein